MIKIFTLAEVSRRKIQRVSYELITWAKSLCDCDKTEVISILPGEADKPEELCFRGADKVIHINNKHLNFFQPEILQRALIYILEKETPNILLAAATTTGRTIMPYLAVKLRTGLTADCTQLKYDCSTGKLLQTRPAVGGNIMATIETVFGNIQMATVRQNSKPPMSIDKSKGINVEEIKLPENLLQSRISFLGKKKFDDEKSIQDAEIIVSGGRGLKKKENFRLIEEIAHLLGASVGASREAVDRGWIDYPHQVGLSGKTVSPKLYIAVGISGAIQHLAGMQTSKRIVAINNDPEAQIFSVSNFGIVGDLFEILPIIKEKLKEIKSENRGSHSLNNQEPQNRGGKTK